MNKPLKVVRIGNSAGVVLPREVLTQLNVRVGDTLSCSPTDDGVTLSAKDDEFERQMDEARVIMRRYRKALSELAK